MAENARNDNRPVATEGGTLQYRAILTALMSYRDVRRYGKKELSYNGGAPLEGLGDQLRLVASGIIAYADAYNSALAESEADLEMKNWDRKAMIEGTDNEASSMAADSARDRADLASEDFGASYAINGMGDRDEDIPESAGPRFRQLVSNRSMMLFGLLRKSMASLSGIDIAFNEVHAIDPAAMASARLTAEDADNIVRALSAFSDSLPNIQDIIPGNTGIDIREAIAVIQDRIASASRDNPYIGVHTAVESLLGHMSIEALNGEKVILSKDRLSLSDTMPVFYAVKDMDSSDDGLYRIADTLTRNRNDAEKRYPDEKCIRSLQLLSMALSRVDKDEELDKKIDSIREKLEAFGYREGVDGFEPIPLADTLETDGDRINENIINRIGIDGFSRAEGEEKAVWELLFQSGLGISNPSLVIARTHQIAETQMAKAEEKAKEGSDKALRPESIKVSSFRDLDKKIGDTTYLESLGLKTATDTDADRLLRNISQYHKYANRLAALRVTRSLYDGIRPMDFTDMEKDKEAIYKGLANRTVYDVGRWAMRPGNLPEYRGFSDFIGLDTRKAAQDLRTAARNGIRRVDKLPGRGYLDAGADASDSLRSRLFRGILSEDDPASNIVKSNLHVLALSVLHTAILAEGVDAEREKADLRILRDGIIDDFMKDHASDFSALMKAVNITEAEIRTRLLDNTARGRMFSWIAKENNAELTKIPASFRNEVMERYLDSGEKIVDRLAARIAKEAGIPERTARSAAYGALNDRDFTGRDMMPWYGILAGGRAENIVPLQSFQMTMEEYAKKSRALDELSAKLKTAEGDEKARLTRQISDYRGSYDRMMETMANRVEELLKDPSSPLGRGLGVLAAEASDVARNEADNVFRSSMKSTMDRLESEAEAGIGALMNGDLAAKEMEFLRTMSAMTPESFSTLSMRGITEEERNRLRDAVHSNPALVALDKDAFLRTSPFSTELTRDEASALYDKVWARLEPEFEGYSKTAASGLSAFPEKAEKAVLEAYDSMLGVEITPERVLGIFIDMHPGRTLTEAERSDIHSLDMLIKGLEERVGDIRKELVDYANSIIKDGCPEGVYKAFSDNAAFVAADALSYDEFYNSADGNPLEPEVFLRHFSDVLRTGDENAARRRAAALFDAYQDGYSEAFAKALDSAISKNGPEWDFLENGLGEGSKDAVSRMLRRGEYEHPMAADTEKAADELSKPVIDRANALRNELFGRQAEIRAEFLKTNGLNGALGTDIVAPKIYFGGTRDEAFEAIRDRYGSAFRAASELCYGAHDDWQKAVGATEAVSRVGKEVFDTMIDAVTSDLSFRDWADANIKALSSFNVYKGIYDTTVQPEIDGVIKDAAVKAVQEAKPEWLRNTHSFESVFALTVNGYDASGRVDMAYREALRDAYDALEKSFLGERDAYIKDSMPELIETAEKDREARLDKFYATLKEKEAAAVGKAGNDENAKTAAIKSTERNMRGYLERELSIAVQNRGIPAPYKDTTRQFYNFIEAVDAHESAINEKLIAGTETAEKILSFYRNAAVSVYRSIGGNDEESEKVLGDMVTGAYAKNAFDSRASELYAEAQLRNEAAREADEPMREDAEKAHDILSDVFSKSIVPVPPSDILRSSVLSMLPENERADLENLALYTRSILDDPEGKGVSEEKRLSADAAMKAFSSILRSHASVLAEENRSLMADKEYYYSIGDPSRLYNPTKQYTAALKIKDAYDELTSIYDAKDEASAVRRGELREEITARLGVILANNPQEKDAERYREALLSGSPETRAEAGTGLRRLAVMGDDTMDGTGVKGWAMKQRSFPSSHNAIDMSTEFSDRMRSQLPGKNDIRRADRAIRENTAAIELLDNEKLVPVFMSMMTVGTHSLLKELPVMTFMKDENGREMLDEEALRKLGEAIGIEDTTKKNFIREANEIWAYSEAENGLIKDRDMVVSVVNSYGRAIGDSRYAERMLIGTFRELAAFADSVHRNNMSNESQIEYFLSHKELSGNPLFAEITRTLESRAWLSDSEMKEDEIHDSNVRSFIRALSTSGTAKEAVHMRGDNFKLQFEADGRPKIQERGSFLKALYNATGRMGSVIYRGTDGLLYDKTRELEARETREGTGREVYIPNTPGISSSEKGNSHLLSIGTSSSNELIRRDKAIEDARKDSLVAGYMPEVKATDALTPKKSTYVLDLHEVPDLKAETVIDALYNQLLRSPTYDKYISEFFRKENVHIVKEAEGLAVLEFEPVQKESSKGGSTYMQTFGSGKSMNKPGGHLSTVRRALETVLAGYGFHTKDGSAYFHVHSEDGKTLLDTKIREASLRKSAELQRKAEAVRELTENGGRREMVSSSLSDSYLNTARGGRG